MDLDYSISRPLAGAVKTVLSLGAGVQSSTLALMAARGDLPRPDVAIFADTGWEPIAVYEWLDWLEARLPFPVVRARRPGPNLGEMMLQVADGTWDSFVPSPSFFVTQPDGMLPLQCSKEFKTRVVQTAIREMLGLAPKERGPKAKAVEQWIGMSTDELQRLKDSEVPWIHNRWPLLERRMNRTDCLVWMEQRQFPRPPKSSCIFCPMRDAPAWLRMKEDAPEDFANAVNFDRAIRRLPGHVEGEVFVHRQRVPLDQISFANQEVDQMDLFQDDCSSGMCGT